MKILNLSGWADVQIEDHDGVTKTYPRQDKGGSAEQDVATVTKFIQDNPYGECVVIVPMWMAWIWQKKKLPCVFLGFEKITKPCKELGTEFVQMKRINGRTRACLKTQLTEETADA